MEESLLCYQRPISSKILVSWATPGISTVLSVQARGAIRGSSIFSKQTDIQTGGVVNDIMRFIEFPA